MKPIIANSLSLRNEKRVANRQRERALRPPKALQEGTHLPQKLALSFFCYELGVFKLRLTGRLTKP